MAQLRMINEPGLVEQVQSSLYEAGMISLTEVRDCISNPRIRDFYVRDLDASGLPLAGISALSEICSGLLIPDTDLGENPRRERGV
ncbi:hypothetical protein [Pseudomonas aeruginosa]|uniref:Uncharacterized protein n=1 Tax=Pseudomonas fluorescens TaxID=294 RepID=A0A448BQZ8_PSEFL|nr:hypothetical protein [Pseudomonas aeruginosa]VEE47722.1 Uncharacterised protein [Pseudomonas fluorescens]ERF08426.1 hypothetical protein PA13_1011530 [Pseudomonas aeruginosa HB13]MCS7783364.1 hypothetical protein [Pseudomonas aeruginosa]MCV6145639.1 hypothetical protein [Pseudomonas aeruginosa]MCW0958242.1 hypothetical protein [Pseudomonas aeruginosa]